MKKIELLFTAILLPLDLFGVFLSILIANNLRISLDILPIGENRVSYIGYSFLVWYIPLLVLLFSGHRLYILFETRHRIQQLFRIISATAVAAMVHFVAVLSGRTPFAALHFPHWFSWANHTSLLAIFYFWISTVIIVTFLRWFYRGFLNTLLAGGIGRRVVLLIGTADVAQQLYHAIHEDSTLGYQLVGCVQTDHSAHSNMLIVGYIADIESIINKVQPDQIIQADPDLSSDDVLSVIDAANDHHIDFTFAPNLFEVLATNVTVSNISGIPLLDLRRTPLDGWGKIVKRALDFVISLALLLLLLPLIGGIGLVIRLLDGGPVFFAHERVSSGTTFKMYKFRSMVKNAEVLEDMLRAEANERDDGPLFKMKNDPRVTPFGRFLRKSRIDEIPQLFNVLTGDMSLVGPRPHLKKEVDQYQKHHRKVLAVKPGMTGIAQLSGSSDLHFEEEVRLDTYYVENWSLMRDIEILLKTPFIILFKDRSGS